MREGGRWEGRPRGRRKAELGFVCASLAGFHRRAARSRNSNDFAENVCRRSPFCALFFVFGRKVGSSCFLPLLPPPLSCFHAVFIPQWCHNTPPLPLSLSLLFHAASGYFSHENLTLSFVWKVFTSFSRKITLISPYNTGVMSASVVVVVAVAVALSPSPLSVSALARAAAISSDLSCAKCPHARTAHLVSLVYLSLGP